MAEAKKQKEQEAVEQAVEAMEQPARPNRDRYASMFAEDNPDIDFEDKEARYGRLADERENYRTLRESGRGLSAALDKNRWMGAMFQDLAKNPDKDPISWMYDNGIDVQKAMEDEEYRQQVAEGLKAFQKKQAEGEKNAQEIDDNLSQSAAALDAMSKEQGLSDEQCNRMWSHLFEEVVAAAMKGIVAKETWELVKKALNYDNDIKSAREESAMQARNEKFANKVKTFANNVPPSFSQGQAQKTAPAPKRKSMSMDFDEMKQYGY